MRKKKESWNSSERLYCFFTEIITGFCYSTRASCGNNRVCFSPKCRAGLTSNGAGTRRPFSKSSRN